MGRGQSDATLSDSSKGRYLSPDESSRIPAHSLVDPLARRLINRLLHLGIHPPVTPLAHPLVDALVDALSTHHGRNEFERASTRLQTETETDGSMTSDPKLSMKCTSYLQVGRRLEHAPWDRWWLPASRFVLELRPAA